MAGMNDIYTMTPGSAVADQLQQILTRKRNESRQAMLDDINRRATEARINYENENAASLADYRASNAQFRQAQADKDWIANLGAMPTSIDKETYERGAKLQPGSFQMTQPQGPTPDGATLDPSYQYLGSPQYQQEQQTIHGIGDLTNDPEFGKLTPEQKLMRIMQIPGAMHTNGLGPVMERLLTSKAQQGGRLLFADEATKKVTDQAGHTVTDFQPTDHVVNVPRPPRDPQAPAMVPFVDKNPDGTPRYLGYNPRANTFSPSKIEGDTPINDLEKVGSKTTPTSIYGEKQAAALRAAFQRTGNATNVRQAREAAEADFINSIVDPKLRQDVMSVRNNKQARMLPVDKLMPLAAPPPGITDEAAKAKYLSDLRTILSQLPNYPRLADQ